MYDPQKDKFEIINNIDYLTTQNEKTQIDNFLLSIDTTNYPYLTETISDLDNISDRIFKALFEYDKKRLKKL